MQMWKKKLAKQETQGAIKEAGISEGLRIGLNANSHSIFQAKIMITSEEPREREIIEIILKQQQKMPRMPVAFGDDVSACEIDHGKLAVLKTDMFVGKTDMPPAMSLWQAARKAVIMNISDFASKGVKPLAVLVSLGLPHGLTKRDVEDLGKGLNAGAREYNTFVIGGDTGEASDLVISISLFGLARNGSLMLRSGARPGDVVAVTGPFGEAAAGLRFLLQELKIKAPARSKFLNAVLMPNARLDVGLVLSRTKAVTASMDSSDGLAWSLYEIAKSSKVGFQIDTVPSTGEVEEFAKMNKLDPTEFTLYGGEEYELVLTLKSGLFEEAKKAVSRVGANLLRIGKVTAHQKIVLKNGRKSKIIEARGYEHFRGDKF